MLLLDPENEDRRAVLGAAVRALGDETLSPAAKGASSAPTVSAAKPEPQLAIMESRGRMHLP